MLPGDLVWVTFGGFGKQLARIGTNDGQTVKVHKWRNNSRQWTGLVTLEPPAFRGYVGTVEAESSMIRNAISKLPPTWIIHSGGR